MFRLSVGLVLASSLVATPLAAQADAWQNKWYWGVQGGIIAFKTPPSIAQLTTPGPETWSTALTVGGHWLITAGRSALYFAYDELLFDQPDGNADTSAVFDPAATFGIRDVAFTKGRRIQAHIYVVPLDNWIQPFIGGGFSIHQVTDATPLGADLVNLSTSQFLGLLQTIDETATRSFPVFTGGLQLRFSRLAAFGHYQFMPTGRNFLLPTSQHVFAGGVRYALTGAREEVTTRR